MNHSRAKEQIFSADPKTGLLTSIGWTPTQGNQRASSL